MTQFFPSRSIGSLCIVPSSKLSFLDPESADASFARKFTPERLKITLRNWDRIQQLTNIDLAEFLGHWKVLLLVVLVDFLFEQVHEEDLFLVVPCLLDRRDWLLPIWRHQYLFPKIVFTKSELKKVVFIPFYVLCDLNTLGLLPKSLLYICKRILTSVALLASHILKKAGKHMGFARKMYMQEIRDY